MGDAVTEPGALLRRLLHQPFPEAEERALQQQSLLFIRSEEAKGTNAYPMAVSLPNLQEPRSASLTLPNPSMPSVDITVQFAAVTDPREFERVMLAHYKLSTANRSFARNPRRSFSSPISSYQDLLSSDVSSVPNGAYGVALQAPPHAVVLAFNPFSTCSFSKLRVEWVHALRVLRQQCQQLANASAQQQHTKRSTSAALVGSSVPASPLTSTFLAESVETFPAVVLVATRMELMRDAMEATPSIHVPSSLEVTEVARALQAQAYVEVGTNWDESMDVLRVAIARACMGELTNAPLVAYNAAYGARQASITHALETVQQDPYGEREEATTMMNGNDDNSSSGTEKNARDPAAALAASGGQRSDSVAVQDDAGVRAEECERREGGRAAVAAEETRGGETAAKRGIAEKTHEQEQRQKDEVVDDEQQTTKLRDASLNSDSADNNRAEKRQGREEGADSSGAVPNASDAAVNTTAVIQTGEPTSPKSPMRGRQLRRHLVTALAPLVAPEDKKSGADGVSRQSSTDFASSAPTSTQATTPEAAATAADAAPASTSDGHAKRHRHRHSASLSATAEDKRRRASARWTWRRHPRTGRVFYVDRTTRKSQYDCPADYDGPLVTTDITTTTTTTAAAAAAAAAAGEQADAEEQPAEKRGVSAEGKSSNSADAGEERAESAAEAGPDFSQASTRVAGALNGEEEEVEHTADSEEDEYEEDASGQVRRSGSDQNTREDVGSWQQRQQLRLRRTQVARLEHQIQQLSLQLGRLRAQSEANADLKRKVATLRAELDDKEQAFSARVADQNQQLAKEVLNTTVAVEELSAMMAPAPHKATTTAAVVTALSGGPEDEQAVGGGGPRSPTGEGAPLTGYAKDIQQLDCNLRDSTHALQLVLSRRAAEAECAEALQRRRQRTAQRTREAEAEVTALLTQAGPAEEALLTLQQELEDVQTEARQLRERVRALEEHHLAHEEQRQRQLMALVAEKRAVQKQVEQLEQLQRAFADAQETYEAALRRFTLPADRVRPAEAQEENTRLRLGLESATGRCAEALLQNAEAVNTLTVLARNIEAAARRITLRQTEQHRRLMAACEGAEGRQAAAVQLKYSSRTVAMLPMQHVAVTACGADGGHDDSSLLQRMSMELLDAEVEACAEALKQWRTADAHVAAPLLERASSVESELRLLLSEVADATGLTSTTAPMRRDSDGPDLISSAREPPLCARWLQARVAAIRGIAEDRCRSSLHAFLQHMAAAAAATAVAGSTVERDANVSDSGTPGQETRCLTQDLKKVKRGER